MKLREIAKYCSDLGGGGLGSRTQMGGGTNAILGRNRVVLRLCKNFSTNRFIIPLFSREKKTTMKTI